MYLQYIEGVMKSIQELENRRNAILEEMASIRSMKRGTINEQYLKVKHKDKEEPVLRGPYFVLSRREGNKTVSQRLSRDELAQAKNDLAEHKRFVSLCSEFEQLTERLGELERQSPNLEQKKKQHKSTRSKTEKSRNS